MELKEEVDPQSSQILTFFSEIDRKTGLKVFEKSLQTFPCFPSFLRCAYILFVLGPKNRILKKITQNLKGAGEGAGREEQRRWKTEGRHRGVKERLQDEALTRCSLWEKCKLTGALTL